ncbi:sugar ABC transporter ATP-binding protein [Bacillus cereus group sp. BfR-BA-01380]|uniref:sugar ABC transporter ATP-binding protein n=1 Tax=Bacillus cereus group sp. BfR-BA-01380 TaxID=2920324 RepID=UPI001F57FA4D|nr:sugar ABC transporter ATP-binding protein [Bacillus cereus group sp. BfR-BA-01380]
MGIHEHHARNGKRLFFVSIFIFLVAIIAFILDYVRTPHFQWNKGTTSFISMIITAFLFMIYSFVERERAKKIGTTIHIEGTSSLLHQHRFVVRREVSFVTTVTYFSMDGNTMGILREEYETKLQKVWKIFVSLLLKSLNEKRFVLYNELGEELLIVRQRVVIPLSYTFHDLAGNKICELKQTLSLKKLKWILLSEHDGEIGEITGDLYANIQKGQWEDGSNIEVKEDAIPVEAIKYFSASGGSLVNLSVVEHAKYEKALYYAVAAILTLKNS